MIEDIMIPIKKNDIGYNDMVIQNVVLLIYYISKLTYMRTFVAAKILNMFQGSKYDLPK